MTKFSVQSNNNSRMPGIAASLTPLTVLDGLGKKWRLLEQRSDCSFFQSWMWIGTWLAKLPSSAKRYLLEVTDDGETIGLAVIVASTLVRHRFVRSRALLLHETGSHDMDRMTIEYNSFVAEAGREREVISEGMRCMGAASVAWDEFVVSGVGSDAFEAWQAAIADSKWHLLYRQQSDCLFVDLCAIRDAGGDYLALLSANTRQQVRRSIKGYEKLGSLNLSVASTGEVAIQYLHDLQALHDAHWASRGKEGAFPNDFTRAFHDQLVLTGINCGAVQLLRVSAGEEVVGYLYNFVRNGHIYFYQSGVKYSDNPKVKPGLVCHYLAVMHNLQAGNRIYDFLAGPQRYKQSLATAEARMVWFSLQRPRLIFALENLLQRVKKVARSHF